MCEQNGGYRALAAVVWHLLGRRSENGFLAEIRADWPGLFLYLPHQPEVDRGRPTAAQLPAWCGAPAAGEHDECLLLQGSWQIR
jgi:hypothetical protein